MGEHMGELKGSFPKQFKTYKYDHLELVVAPGQWVGVQEKLDELMGKMVEGWKEKIAKAEEETGP